MCVMAVGQSCLQRLAHEARYGHFLGRLLVIITCQTLSQECVAFRLYRPAGRRLKM